MKIAGKIALSELNSSGGGTLTYKSKLGSIILEYDRWGEIVSIPTSEEWAIQYATSWARDHREVIVQDIISQMVNNSRPDFKITKYGVTFFNAKKLEEVTENAIAASKAVQAPMLNEFITAFQKMPDIDRVQTVIWIIDIDTNSAEHAEGLISEVLFGNKSLTGSKLKLAFDKDVPILSGRKYILREFEKVIKQYVNTSHVWRCRLHVQPSMLDIELAHKWFSSNK